MRWIQEHGGPSLGYQSEVETLKKREVSSEVLSTWLSLLNITEAFARGEIPTYAEDPNACRGLAGDVGALVQSGAPDLPDWGSLSTLDRARHLLHQVSARSAKLPRLVLAHTLGVELKSLEAMIDGTAPIVLHQLQALTGLTALPEEFFKTGRLGEDHAVRMQALSRQMTVNSVTPEELSAWLPYAGPLRSMVAQGVTPDELEDLLTALPMLRGNLPEAVPPDPEVSRPRRRKL